VGIRSAGNNIFRVVKVGVCMNTQRTAGSLPAFLIVLLTFALAGCGTDILDYRNIQVVNGKIYSEGANKPFSGMVTNIPDDMVLQSQDSFATIAGKIFNAADPLEAPAMQNLGVSWVDALTAKTVAYCDIPVKDGWFDGHAICKAPQSDDTTTEMSFDKGRLSGEFIYYNSIISSHLLAEVTFNDKGPDGVLKIYSPRTGKIIRSISWRDGVLDGILENYNANTGVVIHSEQYKSGKINGQVISYTVDGKTKTAISNWVDGLQEGTDDVYDPVTGSHTLHGQYRQGKVDGVVTQWDTNGKVVLEKTFQDGVEVPPVATLGNVQSLSPAQDPCVSALAEEFHKEQGPDALITFDQLGAWGESCKQGRTPSVE
jgi:antitoxin component YwqK of YwqJK toxin-antitoxin module